MDRHIKVPIAKEDAKILRAGDYVYITGIIYTARDAAHKRMYEILQKGGRTPNKSKGTGNLLYGALTCPQSSSNWLGRVPLRQAAWTSIHRSF